MKLSFNELHINLNYLRRRISKLKYFVEPQ